MYLDMQKHDLKTLLTGSVLRFKTDRLFRKLGFIPMCWEGSELDPVQKTSAQGELVQLMVLNELLPWAEQCFKKHEELIRSRFLIKKKSNDAIRKAA